MEVGNLIERLQVYFPLSLQESWDNSGLQISPKDRFIKAVLLSLDITKSTLNEAYEKGCNLIIAHHPLLFSSTKKIDKSAYPFDVVYRAIELGIGIYAFHTNLDIADDGLNDYLCELLELNGVEKIEDVKPIRIGFLNKPMEFCEFIEYVKERIDINLIKFVKSNEKKVKKVAVCSGSCMDLLERIINYDFDVFLSSDLKHHQAIFARENGINVIDATHFHTEKFSKLILMKKIKEISEDIKVFMSETENLPWDYK